MMRLLRAGALMAVLLVALVSGYGLWAFGEAQWEAGALARRADGLIAVGLGAEGLGPGRLEALLAVEDPGFVQHSGVDLMTAGAGATTLTQSLAKRLAFQQFRPGIGKIRQTGYAMGLERGLTKAQILALWLDTVEMGPGPQGWLTGFYAASLAVYGRGPKELTDPEFLRLVAVVIAPARFDLFADDAALQDRTARISRLIAGDCAPLDNGDVWLEGCA